MALDMERSYANYTIKSICNIDDVTKWWQIQPFINICVDVIDNVINKDKSKFRTAITLLIFNIEHWLQAQNMGNTLSYLLSILPMTVPMKSPTKSKKFHIDLIWHQICNDHMQIIVITLQCNHIIPFSLHKASGNFDKSAIARLPFHFFLFTFGWLVVSVCGFVLVQGIS